MISAIKNQEILLTDMESFCHTKSSPWCSCWFYIADKWTEQTNVGHRESAEPPGGKDHTWCKRGAMMMWGNVRSFPETSQYKHSVTLFYSRHQIQQLRMRRRNWEGNLVSWRGTWATRARHRMTKLGRSPFLWVKVWPDWRVAQQSLWTPGRTNTWAHPVMRCPLRLKR